ncbi:hypothetical protein N0V93_000943 [Gnomoniopsis smithogilvyi]|uniref:Uncharacterized protein n=1 Tax=Gnomoniopsis smithogilvyi TaxID=1191159 RepID=A0A9W9D0Q7_9PEZI|nr:hypothetical protein N0V93_000943 [Gnomoniopsis smithogilvyi]
MFANANTFLIALLAASPLVAAHGKVAAVVGDAGGNGTAIGIEGAVVPGAGSNSKTEVDTTVFKSTKIASNGLGKTTNNGNNAVTDVAQTMVQSGSTLPQVSNSINATFHVVTSDGCGPIKAMLDTGATGEFASGTALTNTADIAGNKGNCPSSIAGKRSVVRRVLESTGLIAKRATNVNKDFNVAFSVPAGTTCTGTVAGQSNVCLVKIANENAAGPFGGVVAIQMAGAATTNTTRRAEKVWAA